jgi:hypothetical protein
MGFFSKVFKGVGKVFRKIGRGLKKVVGKIGKFMGKIGIVGQIALGLLLPGVGSMLSGMLGSVGGALAGSSNILLRGAGQFIEKAISLGTQVGNAFSTVTEGITKVVGETVGTFANELGLGDITKTLTGGKIDIANKNFGNLFERTSEAITNTVAEVKDIFSPLSSATPTSLSPPEIEKARILEAKKAGVELPEWDKVVDISEVANENTLGYTPASTTSPSLLDRGITAIKEAPARFGEAVISTLEDYPKEIAGQIKSGVTTQAMQKLGLEDEPVYNVTNVSGYVPTIDLEGTSDTGIASAQFNPIDYMANNSEAMSLKPFGFNANIYNYANQYKGAMSQYGYAV